MPSACPVCRAEFEEADLRFCSRCGSDMRARPAPPEGADAWIGKVVDGRYKVVGRIGTGGMGVVYRVEHLRLGKVAAMKVLHRDLAGDEEVLKRFRREAEAVSRLNHPNIVQTFDFGIWDGLLFLIMEYVKGDDLGALVKREGPLPLHRALPLIAQVCSALDEAHHLGVVHRDLKPDNIVRVRRRAEDDQAKVLDFGLAKLRERPERSIAPWEGRMSPFAISGVRDAGEITAAGHLVGTPYYMSPEQVKAESVDHRSDLYSLGATLYRVVTGFYPFEGESPVAIVAKHLNEPLVPPSERAPDRALPPELDALVLRAMARKRDDRYQSAAEMREAIQTVMAGLGAVARPSGAFRPSRPSGAPEEILPIAAIGSEPADDLAELRREDFDAYERALRSRRRVASFVVTPVLLAGLALAGWAAVQQLRPRPVSSEVEPNDTPATASLLPQGKPVSGRVGPPRPGGEPDVDYYKIPAGKPPRAVTARLTGVPGVDLMMELYDARGARLIRADGGRKGEAEVLGPVSIGGSEAYLRVRPAWVAGEPPQGALETPYLLTVEWGAPRADWELEPNDTPDAANEIDPDLGMRGRLRGPEDEDWYQVKVPPGMRVEGKLDGVDGLDLVVLLGAERKAIDGGGFGEDESFEAAPDKDGRVLIGVAEHVVARKLGKKPPPHPDRDEPYTLRIRLRPVEGRR